MPNSILKRQDDMLAELKDLNVCFDAGLPLEQVKKVNEIWANALQQLQITPSQLYKALENPLPVEFYSDKVKDLLKKFSSPHGKALYEAYKILHKKES